MDKIVSMEKETLKEEQAKVEETEETAEPSALETLQKNYDELYDKHLRTLAEYENYKRRTLKERSETYVNAQADAITELLPVLDNLERAAVTEEESPLAEGVQMVLKQLLEILGKLKVSEIEAVGKTFDPNVHNAVMHVEDDSVSENTVVEQFSKGYKMGDKVIRYSMVKVAN